MDWIKKNWVWLLIAAIVVYVALDYNFKWLIFKENCTGTKTSVKAKIAEIKANPTLYTNAKNMATREGITEDKALLKYALSLIKVAKKCPEMDV